MRILFFILITVLLSSCVDYDVESKNGYFFEIDTLTIHGVEHEFILSTGGRYLSGITHSPECPCLKNEED